MSVDSLLATLYYVVGLLVALVAHEYAHAWTAVRLGDSTPRMMRRLTLDPRPHLDPFGSFVLPGLLLIPVLFGRPLFPVFAYGKPFAANPWNLRRQDRHLTLIALAGPAVNVVLGFAFGGIYRAVASTGGQLARFVGACLIVNVIMAVTQLVPIPGLDGSYLVARALSGRARDVYQNLNLYCALFILLIFFVFSGPIFSFVRVIANGVCGLAAGVDCI